MEAGDELGCEPGGDLMFVDLTIGCCPSDVAIVQETLEETDACLLSAAGIQAGCVEGCRCRDSAALIGKGFHEIEDSSQSQECHCVTPGG